MNRPGITVFYSVDHTKATEIEPLSNLFSNFDSRAPHSLRGPFFDSTYTPATYKSCYKVECVDCGDEKFILNVSFSEKVHIHALLMVFEYISGSNDIFDFDIYMIHHGTEFYCGRSSKGNHATSGFEKFCNLEAKDVRIEGIPDNGATSWIVTICTFGLFGTIYESPTAVPASVDIQQGI